MRRLSIVTLMLGAVLVGACSSRDSTSPRGITPDQSLATVSTSSCSFSTMKSDAKNFFASTQDSVYTYIGNMQQAFNKFGAAAATPIGWQIQHIVAAERLTSAQGGTSAAGAIFVRDVFNCTTIVPDTAFTNHAATVLSLGIFEVRGDKANAKPAWAWLSVNNARTAAHPAWGVESVGDTVVGFGTWDTTHGTYLIYGYPKNDSTTVLNPAAAIDSLFNAFELGTVPATGSKSGLRVGVCVNSVVAGGTQANRLLHNGNILVNSLPGALCSSAPSISSNTTTTGMKQWLASLFTVRPLFAQTPSDFTGGTPDGWSPFGTGALVGSSISLTFTTQPPLNTFADSTFDVVVQAQISGVPVPGVAVTLSVANNSGSPAGAVINGGANPTDTTDAHGNAPFTISVGKAGGYTISANGLLTTVPTQSGLSIFFNVKNK